MLEAKKAVSQPARSNVVGGATAICDTSCEQAIAKIEYHIFPRISSPFCFFAFWGSLCFPLTRQTRYIICFWGPNSSLDMCTVVWRQLDTVNCWTIAPAFLAYHVPAEYMGRCGFQTRRLGAQSSRCVSSLGIQQIVVFQLISSRQCQKFP